MAGLHSNLRPTSISSSQSSPLLLLLTFLPLTLAAFAFFLQWRGGIDDPTTRWMPENETQFPGMGSSTVTRTSSSGCVNVLSQKRSPTFPYFRDWKFGYGSDLNPKVMQGLMVYGAVQIDYICDEYWRGTKTKYMYYYKYLCGFRADLCGFVEGKTATANVSNVLSNVLESVFGVKVIYRTKQLEEEQAKSPGNKDFSRIWNESWLSSFFYKPCNYELFVKQSLNMEMAIVLARESGMDWIIHLDTDELLHPAGTRGYSVRELMSNVPENFDIVVFPNYESSVERDDIKDPFSEVSMFQKNLDHLPKETYYGHYKEATRDNPNYFLTYGNGKAAARIVDHLRPNGAHRWHNYIKLPNEIKLEEAAVLHYTYPKFSDLTSRRDRCGCKPTEVDVKRCFMLDFDRALVRRRLDLTSRRDNLDHNSQPFRYREHIVWTDEALKLKLLKKGILTRIYAPMVIIQGLRESRTFISVIESAQTDTYAFVSIEPRNISRASKSRVLSLRKIGKPVEIQAISRKMLDILDDVAAIPPLSPPSMDNVHLDT